MRVQRTLAPAAAPLRASDLLRAVAGLVVGRRYRRRLLSEVREYFGVRHAFLTCSGKAALTLILRGLARLAARPEVVIPAYTCFAVPAAIVRAGLEIRLVDTDPGAFDFDFPALRTAVGGSTLAIVLNHLFGIASDVDRVSRLCRDHGVFVIEDAAQAMGVRHEGRLLGTRGDVGFFSIGRGKCVTAGSGGIVVTNSDRIAEAIEAEYRRLPAAGIRAEVADLLRLALTTVFVHPGLYWLPSNLAFLRLGETRFDPAFPMTRLSGTSAGALGRWKDRLAAGIEIRRRSAARYASVLARIGATNGNLAYLRVPVFLPSREMRDRAYRLAKERGLGMSRMYPTAVHRIPELRPRFEAGEFPAATAIADTLLTLPNHRFVRDSDREAIAAVLTSGPAGAGP